MSKKKSHRKGQAKVVSARILKSPLSKKKWRAVVRRADGTERSVDFGASGMSDYTLHKDAHRMARYVRRHGAGERVDLEATKRWSPKRVHREVGRVARSDLEAWDDPGTAGYWSRWLLWSEPTLRAAARGIERRHGFSVHLGGDGSAKPLKA